MNRDGKRQYSVRAREWERRTARQRKYGSGSGEDTLKTLAAELGAEYREGRR